MTQFLACVSEERKTAHKSQQTGYSEDVGVLIITHNGLIVVILAFHISAITKAPKHFVF